MQVIEPIYKWAYNLTPRSQTTHLILHHAAAVSATAEGIHSYHLSKGWAGIAYHYFVTKDGRVIRGRPENMRGGHTSGFNYCSIGICFEGNFDEEKMGMAQLLAGSELIGEIKSRFPSILVGGHKQFDNSACPGINYPFADLVKEKQDQMKPIDEQSKSPDEWAADACNWAIEKGLFVGDGNFDFHWHEGVTRQVLAVILMRYANAQNRIL